MAVVVNADMREGECIFTTRFLATSTPQDDLNASHEFAWTEGFGQVIIRADC